MAWGGRYKFNAISQPVDDAVCVSLRSLPPKEAIVAAVLKVMLTVVNGGGLSNRYRKELC
jgi:hypothetical protein